MNARLLIVAISAAVACVVCLVVAFLFRGGSPAPTKTVGVETPGGSAQIPVSLAPIKRLPETDWIASAASNALPFSIENRKYGSCYAQRIVFRSGKPLPLYSYASAGSSCEVFSLGDGVFLLEEGWNTDLVWRRRYRVNSSNETLEVGFEGLWIKVPDGAQTITGIKADAGEAFIEVTRADGPATGRECTPVDDQNTHHVYLGTSWPDGRFTGPAEN